MKIKALLLGLIMLFAGIPVSADVIEVDKPVEPKEITVQEIKIDKAAYHVGEDINLSIKIDGFSSSDIGNIGYLRGYLDKDGDYPYKLYYSKEKKVFENKISFQEGEGSYSFNVVRGIRIYSNKKEDITSLYKEKYAWNCNKHLNFVINNNCADGLHTVYKDNWKRTKFPTCKTEGLDVRYCNICKQVADSKIVPKLSHVKTDWITTRKPTVWNDGIKVVKCSECNSILQSKKIPKLPSTKQLKFYKESITIKKGKTTKLKYIRKPINAKDKISWKSSNPKAVKILKNGKIKGIKKGKSIVTLSTNTKKKARIIVKVK